jgi:hypothetical protein
MVLTGVLSPPRLESWPSRCQSWPHIVNDVRRLHLKRNYPVKGALIWALVNLHATNSLRFLKDLRLVLLRAWDYWRAGASGTDVVRELCSRCTGNLVFGSVRATVYINDDSRLTAMTTLLR